MTRNRVTHLFYVALAKGAWQMRGKRFKIRLLDDATLNCAFRAVTITFSLIMSLLYLDKKHELHPFYAVESFFARSPSGAFPKTP
jgi:hypothetical protein